MVDILIDGEKIVDVRENIPKDGVERVYDLQGMEVFPGGIDSHVHFNYVQGGDKAVSADDFGTGSMAAIAGGTTTVMDFVEPKQGETAYQTLQKRKDTADHDGVKTDYAFHFSVCNREQIPLIKDAAKVEESFKIYTVYNGIKIDSTRDMFDIFSEIAKYHKIAMVHCENDQVISENVPKAKIIQEMPQVRPEFNEIEATTRVLTIGELTNCSVHIAHATLPDQVRIINIYAKQRHYSPEIVTCEATAHHLLLDNRLYSTHPFKEDLVMSPPLQAPEKVEEMKRMLADGAINWTVSDHCPFTRDQRNGDFAPFQATHTRKQRKFFEMPGGTNGVQVRFILTYSTMKQFGCGLQQIAMQTSQNAADRFHLAGKGRICAGYDADLVVVNPSARTVFSLDQMKERMDGSLFEGQVFKGQIEKVFVRGREAGRDELLPGRYLRAEKLQAGL